MANPLLASSQAQAENRTVPTPRDRAEPLVPRVPPPIPRLFFFPTTAPLFLHLAPAGLAVLAVFLLFAFSALLPFWALPFWGDCCLFRLPPPPAACSARPAGVALSISHLYPAPKNTNGGTVTPDGRKRSSPRPLFGSCSLSDDGR